MNRKKNKWSNERFNAVDWEHLELALKNNADMYRIWLSKQNLGFCSTRVQVGRYSGDLVPNKQCPNCGRHETAAHLMLCLDDDHTKLLVKNVDELAMWMSRDNKMDPEILYWIPEYIIMRGDKPISKCGHVPSEDLIGWRDFTEGYISTHFYTIQSFHLTMSSGYINGEDWTTQFISKILQITHCQWIF